jgi:hypothetical protein
MQAKNIMLNLYPKRVIPQEQMIQEEEETVTQQPHYEEFNDTGKMTDKWIYSAIIGGISVFLFSSFFLDVIDDICMKRDTSAFNSKGDPKFTLIIVIFIVITLVSRTFFSLL